MIKSKKIITVIPARGGSKGLPAKNIMELCGRPLIGWPIQAALNSKYIDKIIVSTDSSIIANIASEQGAEVPFLRPIELATDDSTTQSVIEHAIDFFLKKGEQFDYCVLLEPTSPLTTTDDINKALEQLESSRMIADAIVGVSRLEATHPDFCIQINHKGLIQPFILDDFSKAGRRQELNEYYFLDGSLYISDVLILINKKGFYHKRTLPFITPKWKSLEIDDYVDFICIEAIMKNINKIKDKNSP